METQTHRNPEVMNVQYVEGLLDEEKSRIAALKNEIKTPLSGTVAHATLLAYAHMRNRPAYTQTGTLGRWSERKIRYLASEVRNVIAEQYKIPASHVSEEGKAERKKLLESVLKWLVIPAPSEWTAVREANRQKYLVEINERKAAMREKYKAMYGG